MKKYGFIILVLVLMVVMFGCAKKETSMEEMQEPLSMEALSTSTAPTGTAVTSAVPITISKPLESNVQVTADTAATAVKLEALPPSGPFKPTNQQIQTALKNAGFYAGDVDGKIGPKSKKAIEEFQKANNLQADGKVGLKTWAVLGKYLNSEPVPVEASPAPVKKKR